MDELGFVMILPPRRQGTYRPAGNQQIPAAEPAPTGAGNMDVCPSFLL
jgi:hypothetical protein